MNFKHLVRTAVRTPNELGPISNAERKLRTVFLSNREQVASDSVEDVTGFKYRGVEARKSCRESFVLNTSQSN